MPPATSPALTWTVPTRLDAAGLRLRVWAHVVLRALRDLRAARVARHQPTALLADAPAIAERRTPLWHDGRDGEFPLVAGKVENLRIARLAFDGVVVPAGAVFSFWIALVAHRAATPPARGCLTCDETQCFRHPGLRQAAMAGSTAVLVDAHTPEFAAWLREHAGVAAWFTPWLRRARRVTGAWAPAPAGTHTVARLASWWRTWLLHRHAGEGGGRQAAQMRGQQAIAHAFARGLEPRHTHLVVDQGLLVPLARLGALQGRSYDVLVQALPADELQRRLDAAARRWPDAPSLRDFRVDAAHAATERAALRGARRLVTSHAEVARHMQTLAPARVDQLAWTMPTPRVARAAPRARATPLVAFPASALARKGAHELAAALRHLGWRLLVLGTPSGDPGLWRGVEVEHASFRDAHWLARADVVALPAHVEHSPRALLLALAHGLPVIATPACGLPASGLVHAVEPGDVDALIAALTAALATRRQAEEILTPS